MSARQIGSDLLRLRGRARLGASSRVEAYAATDVVGTSSEAAFREAERWLAGNTPETADRPAP